MKVIGVTGWKNAGKTTLVEKLVEELVRRGLKVSTVKHAHHRADVDEPGRDSFKHRAAGAHQVMLATPERWALMTELRMEPEPTLAELVARMDRVDVLVIEGFKSGDHPKIEVVRPVQGKVPIAVENHTVVALAVDGKVEMDLPQLDLNDPGAVADFVMEQPDV